ncbi:MAG: HlyD family efflux transporter periplasmic adaptor subunit [Planctomycetaceae bacterium]|nr:HlyD family efflux transporter periplasmic adaptor subunit [Planctomycetaceae bacterium]
MSSIIRNSCVTLVGLLWLCSPANEVPAQEPEVKTVRLPVTLEGDLKTELRARIEGYVAIVHGDIGERVTKGKVLVTLDAPELEATVQRRQKMLSQAEASLSVSKGMIEIAKAKLSQAQSARQEQQALLNLKVSIRDRYNVLVDGGAVQREMLDEAIFAVSAVTAAIGKADADIAAAQADVGAAINEVEFAESGIQVAKAELSHAVAQEQFRQIKAPFDGIITERSVDPGQLVSPGNINGKSLLVIEHVDVLRGVLTVPAEDAAMVREGDLVKLIGFPGADKMTAPGGGPLKVSRVSQTLDMKTRTMRVEIDLQNVFDEKTGRYRFLSGQYGAASVTTR